MLQRLLQVLIIGIIVALGFTFWSDLWGRCTHTHYGMRCGLPIVEMVRSQ
jgi:hypothetical protein